MRISSKRTSRAFTLIELLVVIAIIGILAGLLLPTIARTRERGRQAACLANVKSIVAGILLYATDYQNRMALPDPSGYMFLGGATAGGVNAEDRPLYPYLRDVEAFECPSDRGSDWAEASCSHCFSAYGSSYAYPDADVNGIQAVSGLKMTSTNFVYSSKKVVLFEPPLVSATTGARDQWHSPKRAGVVGFLDGHSDLVYSNYASVDPVNNDYY